MDNTVFLTGVITQCESDNGIYKCKINIPRKSNNIDIVPVEIPATLYDNNDIRDDDLVMIAGVMRSRNTFINGRNNHLEIYAHALEVKKADEEEMGNLLNTNFVRLEGYICRKNTMRRKENMRPILSTLLAYNRTASGNHKDSDYIPCVFWGENAEVINEHSTGDRLLLDGRFQSRTYFKRDVSDNLTSHTVYEVSAKNIIKVESRRRINDDVRER